MTPREVIALALRRIVYGNDKVTPEDLIYADQFLETVSAAGLAVVPVEPTEEMLESAWTAAHEPRPELAGMQDRQMFDCFTTAMHRAMVRPSAPQERSQHDQA